MGFSQATITSVAPPVFQYGFAKLSWTSSSPSGTWFQVYADLTLVWWGTQTTTTIPVPADTSSIDIGTVGPGEQMTSFAASLEGTNRFASLSWDGGSYESIDIAGFHVYSGSTPGGAVSYTTPVATITAYPQGIITDGFGDGGFGDGGFGQAASTYNWTSGALAGGTWNFAVKAFDIAGNLSTAKRARS